MRAADQREQSHAGAQLGESPQHKLPSLLPPTATPRKWAKSSSVWD